MTSEQLPCLVRQWLCIFPVLLLTTHISVETFLVMLDIFGQFQFYLSLSIPAHIFACPSEVFTVLDEYLAAFPQLVCVFFVWLVGVFFNYNWSTVLEGIFSEPDFLWIPVLVFSLCPNLFECKLTSVTHRLQLPQTAGSRLCAQDVLTHRNLGHVSQGCLNSGVCIL